MNIKLNKALLYLIIIILVSISFLISAIILTKKYRYKSNYRDDFINLYSYESNTNFVSYSACYKNITLSRYLLINKINSKYVNQEQKCSLYNKSSKCNNLSYNDLKYTYCKLYKYDVNKSINFYKDKKELYDSELNEYNIYYNNCSIISNNINKLSSLLFGFYILSSILFIVNFMVVLPILYGENLLYNDKKSNYFSVNCNL